VRDLLVIHPVESMWMLCRKGWKEDPAVRRYDAALASLRDTLLAANIDFDYGDEDILSRHGKVSGKGKPLLVVGKARYKAVVVPSLLTIRGTTVELLRRFKAAGGTVIFTGRVAEYVDAASSKAAVDLAADCIAALPPAGALVAALEPTCRRISIADRTGGQIAPALHLLREDKNAFYLFVCNTGHDFSKGGGRDPIGDVPVRKRKAAFDDVRIRGFARCKGRPVELDPRSGEAFSADAKRCSRGWEIRTSLPAIGSRLFVIPRKAAAKTFPKRRKLRNVRGRKIDPARWDIVLSEQNNLVLDRPRWRIGSGGWRRADEVLRVDRAVRDAIGLPYRGGMMVQPWARKKAKGPKGVSITLSYKFQVRHVPAGELFLALEQPKRYRAFINGSPVDTSADCDWWTDKSLRRLPINPSLLRRGENEVTLVCEYDENHPGLEIVYLLGTFGVKVRGAEVAVTRLPDTLRLGDWARQGLAFYSGSVTYVRNVRTKLRRGQRLFVLVPDYRGAAVRVFVNGNSAGVVGWEPNEIDITDFAKDSEIELGIEVVGHRRNSHGPLHLRERSPKWTGAVEFVTTGEQWTDSYRLVPCGLMQPPRLIVKQ
ncbi:MAG: hypothetical protein KAU28_08110, partial [Phycisphaerae bacterium]|nr:hypothetical protein [Phycisphaerae bacterium]